MDFLLNDVFEVFFFFFERFHFTAFFVVRFVEKRDFFLEMIFFLSVIWLEAVMFFVWFGVKTSAVHRRRRKNNWKKNKKRWNFYYKNFFYCYATGFRFMFGRFRFIASTPTNDVLLTFVVFRFLKSFPAQFCVTYIKFAKRKQVLLWFFFVLNFWLVSNNIRLHFVLERR